MQRVFPEEELDRELGRMLEQYQYLKTQRCIELFTPAYTGVDRRI